MKHIIINTTVYEPGKKDVHLNQNFLEKDGKRVSCGAEFAKLIMAHVERDVAHLAVRAVDQAIEEDKNEIELEWC